ncbi:MAG: LysR family transcriptional regulator [Bryobacterales bacterium]|nr:LysR family transcriptional regulator [Bryobacteraceae bacterium]MDW8129747.1 LysR family transcriptional regulator [Bryobacterales bacterium]
MDLAHLRLFLDIAHTRSLSRAAALNGVSQSAATQHVQELERRLGVALLDRSHRPIVLTPAGRLYYEFCRDVVRRQEEFAAALQQLKGTVEGVVRVAAIYSVALSEMASLREDFARRFPGASLEVEYLRPEKVYEAVESGRADLGLVSYAESTRQIVARPWRQERMVVAAVPWHALAARPALRPADLQGASFVTFDEDLPIRRHIDQFLREHAVEVRVVLHFDNIPAVKEAVAAGAGVSILPWPMLQEEVRQGRLVAIRLEPAPVRPLGIIHLRRKKFSPATQAFLDLLEARREAA